MCGAYVYMCMCVAVTLRVIDVVSDRKACDCAGDMLIPRGCSSFYAFTVQLVLPRVKNIV